MTWASECDLIWSVATRAGGRATQRVGGFHDVGYPYLFFSHAAYAALPNPHSRLLAMLPNHIRDASGHAEVELNAVLCLKLGYTTRT
jgi:hypothetical protein